MTVVQRGAGHVLENVMPGLWRLVFHLPVTVNCWLWEEADGITLIDAAQPWNVSAIQSAVEILAKRLNRIIVTHAHPDHAGAAAELARRTGASVFAHSQEAAFLRGNRSMADERGYWLCRTLLQSGKALGILNPPPVDNVESVNHGDVIGNLHVLHTPGHTPGSISLWNESSGALFCGDNVSNTLRMLRLNFSHFTLNFADLRKSLSQYDSLPATLLLPGHGPAYRSSSVANDVLKLLPSKFDWRC